MKVCLSSGPCRATNTNPSSASGFRDPNANNQVFFIDTSGALCSRSSGHAIDVEGMWLYLSRTLSSRLMSTSTGDRIVLRHRRPVSHPYPNVYSHPLPKFQYNAQTGEITVHFNYDPTYPSLPSYQTPGTQPRTSEPTPTSTGSWHGKTYFLVSQPLRKPRTIIDDASELITTVVTSPINFLSNAFGGKSASKPEEVFDGQIDLKEEEVVEEERGEEGEIDNSPQLERFVRVVGLLKGSEENMSEKALRRRKWTVSALRRMNARTGA